MKKHETRIFHFFPGHFLDCFRGFPGNFQGNFRNPVFLRGVRFPMEFLETYVYPKPDRVRPSPLIRLPGTFQSGHEGRPEAPNSTETRENR